MGSLPIRPLPNNIPTPVAPLPAAAYASMPGSPLPAASSGMPRATARPMPRSYRPEISPALSDFIDFQTMMASSRYLHLKQKKRVSVAKTSFFSAMLTAGLTAIPVTVSAINGQSEKVFLIPILGTLAAFHGAMLGLLLNHDQD